MAATFQHQWNRGQWNIFQILRENNNQIFNLERSYLSRMKVKYWYFIHKTRVILSPVDTRRITYQSAGIEEEMK